MPESLPGGLFSTKPTDKRPGVGSNWLDYKVTFWISGSCRLFGYLWIRLTLLWLMILGETIPNGLNPNGQWFGDGSSWFFRRIRSLWSRIRRTMVFMDLRLFTFWEVEIPPQKNHAISIGKLMINCWMMLDVAFFFTLNLRRSPFLGWFWPHIPLPAGDFHPFLDARGLGRSATGRIRTTGGVPGIQDDLHDGDLWAV